MNIPSAATVRTWSKLNYDRLGYSDDATLQVVVDRAATYIEQTTGQNFDSIDATLVPVAEEAIQLRTEQKAVQSQSDYVNTGADDQVSQFSAGEYSETRRDPSALAIAQGGSSTGYPMVNPWPALNTLLWMLMTPDKLAFWMALLTGKDAPAFEVTEVDWTGCYTDPNYYWGA